MDKAIINKNAKKPRLAVLKELAVLMLIAMLAVSANYLIVELTRATIQSTIVKIA